MSWGTCYTNAGSNNIHSGFPAIMMDGRNYADWQPGAMINERIRKDAGIKSNWEYRKYLTSNAESIIKHNQLSACSENTLQAGSGQKVSNNSPYLYKSIDDQTMNYGYENSDLKNLYLSEMILQSRMVTPVVTQAQLIQNNFARIN
jgi:hypothetical protein